MGKKEMSFHQRAYDREPLPTWMHELMVSTDPAGEAARRSARAREKSQELYIAREMVVLIVSSWPPPRARLREATHPDLAPPDLAPILLRVFEKGGGAARAAYDVRPFVTLQYISLSGDKFFGGVSAAARVLLRGAAASN